MQSNLKLNFLLKKSRFEPGMGSIIVRLRVNGQRVEFSTGRKCPIEKWDSRRQSFKGNTLESQKFNQYLKELELKLYDIQSQLMRQGGDYSVLDIKNTFFGEGKEVHYLLDVFQDHNRRMKELIGAEFARATWVKYETTLSHLRDFISEKMKLKDIDIQKVNHSFIVELEYYMRSVKKCSHNSTHKYLRNINKIIRICIKNQWLQHSPFANFKTSLKEVNRVFLSEEEIDRLAKKTFKSERMNTVKDTFLFSCYTGLAYIDIYDLTMDQIQLNIRKERWIFTKRRKTNIVCSIPLLPMAEEILEKYNDHPKRKDANKVLPVLSNQKTNEYLKEIADLCGIDKELTFHIARHTFATTITLTNGVPIESVSKMLGHRNLRTTQHYAKIIDQKVGEDMNKLKEVLLKKRSMGA
ncbi:MAG: site-specific integrase [Crocinitomicaceae bacterium]|jgi:site-specific recombinase XerD|nr:site-specific integrase [Crocinitomicaceae bacterium]